LIFVILIDNNSAFTFIDTPLMLPAPCAMLDYLPRQLFADECVYALSRLRYALPLLAFRLIAADDLRYDMSLLSSSPRFVSLFHTRYFHYCFFFSFLRRLFSYGFSPALFSLIIRISL